MVYFVGAADRQNHEPRQSGTENGFTNGILHKNRLPHGTVFDTKIKQTLCLHFCE